MQFQRDYLRDARRKARANRDYFDDEDDEDTFYTAESNVTQQNRQDDEEEVDPLDAFMQGIDAQVEKQKTQPKTTNKEKPEILRQNEQEDRFIEAFHTKLASSSSTSQSTTTATQQHMDYADSDEEVYATAKQFDGDDEDENGKKTIEVLAPLDHTTITYESFRKNFYRIHPDVANMTPEQVKALRQELQVRTDGSNVPSPIQSFMHAGFDRKTLALLMKLGMEAPTAIQSQTFPVAMSGRDIIGIAKTGSGKTLAFTLPLVTHVMDQRVIEKDEGPIAIVLAPTRELAHQIFQEARKFLKIHGAECAAVYGGINRWDQIQALRKGPECVVATPGRLIEMIRKKHVRTNRITFVVLDEADRMFEMGFEPQLRSIMGQIRPDRQTLLFSATFRKRIELLACDVLTDPVKVTIGKIGQANEEIHQVAVVLPGDQVKWKWLMEKLPSLVVQGRLLIFAASKIGCEELTKNLNGTTAHTAVCLHGDKSQFERSEALEKFKSGKCQILIATDVAARGLDIKDVKNVVNYDVAKNIDIHVHRIGRTGRMGIEGFKPGTAYTLVTMKESQFAAQLVYNMDISGQQVSSELISLAKRDPRFRRGPRPSSSSSKGAQEEGGNGGGGYEGQETSFSDDEELERWNQSRSKTKADQRKGLGFGPGSTSSSVEFKGGKKGGGLSHFVKAKTTESSTSAPSHSFRSSFVKSATEKIVPSVHVAPPPPPPPPQALASLQPAQNQSVPPPPPPSADTTAPRSEPTVPPPAATSIVPPLRVPSENSRHSCSRSRQVRRNRSHSRSSSRGRSHSNSKRRRRSYSRSSSSRSSSLSRSRSRSRGRDRRRSRRSYSRSPSNSLHSRRGHRHRYNRSRSRSRSRSYHRRR